MSVTVLIPSPLRPLTGNQFAVQAEGATVAAVIEQLAGQFPPLRPALLAPAGELQPFIRMFVNGKDIAARGGLGAAVADGDEVLILQAISGG